MVSHREFLSDVSGSILFDVVSFPINAGRDTCFPWLSQVASRYERYSFESLRFVYEPRCATSTAGSVILSLDYDALDTAPINKQDVYSYAQTAQSGAWDDCVLTCARATLKSRPNLYVRLGAAPTNADLKTYDLGNLLLCRSGFAGTDVCGELFVEYSVRLSLPQTTKPYQVWFGSASAGLAAGSLFGTTIALGASNTLDLTITSASTVTLLQNFQGVITMSLTGTVLATGGFASTGTCTATLISEMYNAGATAGTLLVNVPNGLRGQTIVLAVSATTVVSNAIRFLPS